jgi:hypothetical protein
MGIILSTLELSLVGCVRVLWNQVAGCMARQTCSDVQDFEREADQSYSAHVSRAPSRHVASPTATLHPAEVNV